MDQKTEYANILNEAKVRILSINTILSGTSSLPTWLTAELCYIQLRMLCELVALGCLIAHGDIEETKTKKLQKKYGADYIIKHLERLHANFYPHPITCEFSENSIHMTKIDSGFLTKQELLNLYHECGEHLHRGCLEKIYSQTKPKQPPQIEKALEWGHKFTRLLSQHHIASLSNNSHFLCFMSHHQANGNALVAIAQSPELDRNLNVV
jgi:hypothetical protein